jgi:hypothetical protein
MITDTEALSTADLVTAAQMPTPQRVVDPGLTVPPSGATGIASVKADESLAPLFQPLQAQEFRATWDAVQHGFVDDPQQAVRKADELVAQVMNTLAKSFSSERAKLESQIDKTDHASTENLRVGLQRYRSFFQRLLSL